MTSKADDFCVAMAEREAFAVSMVSPSNQRGIYDDDDFRYDFFSTSKDSRLVSVRIHRIGKPVKLAEYARQVAIDLYHDLKKRGYLLRRQWGEDAYGKGSYRLALPNRSSDQAMPSDFDYRITDT